MKKEKQNMLNESVFYFLFKRRENGGAMRDRTADLLRAKQALSQLSYSPIFNQFPPNFVLIKAERNEAYFSM